MLVLTVDQVDSRIRPDLVPALLARDFNALRSFERTIGDEVQGVFDDATAALTAALALTRNGDWRVGIGAGAVETPLPVSPSEGRGEAFVLAREAIDRAKTRGSEGVAVVGVNPAASAAADATLRLLVALRARRSQEGWQVYDAGDRSGSDVARELGISQQAVSQRSRAGMIGLETDLLAPLAWLLEQAQEAP